MADTVQSQKSSIAETPPKAIFLVPSHQDDDKLNAQCFHSSFWAESRSEYGEAIKT